MAGIGYQTLTLNRGGSLSLTGTNHYARATTITNGSTLIVNASKDPATSAVQWASLAPSPPASKADLNHDRPFLK